MRKILDLASQAIILSRLRHCSSVLPMYFSLDSVPDEQLTLGRTWMDDSDKENSPEPAQLKPFGLVEGESVLPTGLPDSIASLATRAQHLHAWSERIS